LYSNLLHEVTEDGKQVILEGLEEFREHLGGELTITLIQGIGEGIEVHAMDRKAILTSVDELQNLHPSLTN
jgi:3-dehydroquinate synthase